MDDVSIKRMGLNLEEVIEIEEPHAKFCPLCGYAMQFREWLILAGPGISEDVGECTACGHIISLRNWRAWHR